MSADLSALGGSPTTTLLDDGVAPDATAGDGVFSVSATVAEATAPGAKNLPFTVTDAQDRSGSGSDHPDRHPARALRAGGPDHRLGPDRRGRGHQRPGHRRGHRGRRLRGRVTEPARLLPAGCRRRQPGDLRRDLRLRGRQRQPGLARRPRPGDRRSGREPGPDPDQLDERRRRLRHHRDRSPDRDHPAGRHARHARALRGHARRLPAAALGDRALPARSLRPGHPCGRWPAPAADQRRRARRARARPPGREQPAQDRPRRRQPGAECRPDRVRARRPAPLREQHAARR